MNNDLLQEMAYGAKINFNEGLDHPKIQAYLKYISIENIEHQINKLKETFSTSSITSLQESSKQRQKWPLLNLIRQLLKINGFVMKPFRKSAGYTASGKKKYDRYFYIEEKDNNNNKNELNN